MGILVKIGNALQMTINGNQRGIVYFMESHVVCGQIDV
jgi:hypothetical protein